MKNASSNHRTIQIAIALLLTSLAWGAAEAGEGPQRRMQYTSRSPDAARQWQREVRGELARLLGIDELRRERNALALKPKTLSSANREGYRVEELEIGSTPGRRMRIIVTVPTASEGPRPAVVCVGGHGSTR